MKVSAPVCASETLNGIGSFRDLLASNSAGIIMLDLSWCGGLTVARKIAAMAEAEKLPIAPHDCRTCSLCQHQHIFH